MIENYIFRKQNVIIKNNFVVINKICVKITNWNYYIIKKLKGLDNRVFLMI